ARAGRRRGRGTVRSWLVLVGRGEIARFLPDPAAELLASHIRMAVDDDLADVGEDLGRPILAPRQLEQLRGFVDEMRGDSPGEKVRVLDDVEQEGNVYLHAAHAELLKAAFHVPGRIEKARRVGGHLD